MTSFWHKIGHRGAPREFPANTMRGFKRAIELGCSMVECDVRQAADGEIVLAHDPEVTDISGQHYVIGETSCDVLHALNLGSGEGVPRLEELVSWASGQCGVMADMKCEGNGVEANVEAALRGLNPDAKVIPGASSASRTCFRRLDSTLPLALTLSDHDALVIAGDNFDRLVDSLDTEAITWHHTLLTEERIVKLKARGIKVYAWTVDELLTMRRLRDWGVDGLISNRPDLLMSV